MCDLRLLRHGRDTMTFESVQQLLPDLRLLRTEIVALSGGEPLMNPEWASIGEALRANGQKVWLLTSGLSLAKHARRVCELFDDITVSLDGTDGDSDAFDRVCEGIRAAGALGNPPGIRVTVQSINFRQTTAFGDLAEDLGARQVSFLAVDVASPHAFGRADSFAADSSLQPGDLPESDRHPALMEERYAADFRSGFMAESPQKLHPIRRYFAAVFKQGPYPPVRCNAREFSAVVGPTGLLQPCFFISRPSDGRRPGEIDSKNALAEMLNTGSMVALRTAIREGQRGECKTGVCSMWRDSERFAPEPA